VIATRYIIFPHAPATSELYTLSLHDALPISVSFPGFPGSLWRHVCGFVRRGGVFPPPAPENPFFTAVVHSPVWENNPWKSGRKALFLDHGYGPGTPYKRTAHRPCRRA